MIIYESTKRPMPLLGPQFRTPGPYAPGEIVRMEVPIANERRARLHNLTMRFESDDPELTFSPTSVAIDVLDGGERRSVGTDIIFPSALPATIATSTAKVWALLDTGANVPLRTAVVEVTIEAKPHFRAEFVENRLCLENIGTFRSVVTLDADVDLPESWPAEVALEPGATASLDLPSYPLGPIRICEPDGNRHILTHRTSECTQPELEALARVTSSGVGARCGDVISFEVEVYNRAAMAYDVRMELPALADVSLVDGYTTRNNVPLLPADIDCGSTWTFHLGPIRQGETATIRGAIRVGDLAENVDVLSWDGIVSCRDSSARVRFGERIIQTPLVTPHSTYFTKVQTNDSATVLETDLVVTNAHRQDIVAAALILEVQGAQVESISTESGSLLTLSADAMGTAGTIAEIGSLPAQSRAFFHIVLSRLPGADHIVTDASLLTGGRTVELASLEEVLPIEPHVAIELTALRTSRVRLGAPMHCKVAMRNGGTGTLRGVRVRPVVPDGVEMKFPMRERAGDWCTLGYSLPPGGEIAFPAVIRLLRPPDGSEIRVSMLVDGENAAVVSSEPLVIATPSAPYVSCSEPVLREEPSRGLVEVAVRVSNRSDGMARNVCLFVAPEDRPVPFSARLDGALIDERSHMQSTLLEGLNVGDLPANTQRDVVWLAAPQEAVYRTRITVRADGGIERVVRGALSLDNQQWFATDPKRPNVINEDLPLSGLSSERSAVALTLQRDATEALSAGSDESIRAISSAKDDDAVGDLVLESAASVSLAPATESSEKSTTADASVSIDPSAEATLTSAISGSDVAHIVIDEPGEAALRAAHSGSLFTTSISEPQVETVVEQFLEEVSADENDATEAPPREVTGTQPSLDRVVLADEERRAVDEEADFLRLSSLLDRVREDRQITEKRDTSMVSSRDESQTADDADEDREEVHNSMPFARLDQLVREQLADEALQDDPPATEDATGEDETPDDAQPESQVEEIGEATWEPKRPPVELGDLGLSAVGSLRAMIPEQWENRAVIQALFLRLIGPAGSERHTIARSVMTQIIPSLMTARVSRESFEGWAKDALRRVDEHIAMAGLAGSAVSDPIADNEALTALYEIGELSADIKTPFDEYLAEVEISLPIYVEDMSIPYASLLTAKPLPNVSVALTRLLDAASCLSTS